MRINRYLARCGIGSRRNVEELILSGRVFLNGNLVTDLSTNVDEKNDRVEVDGKLAKLPELKYYMLAKPLGYTCTRKDVHAKKTIFELLPADDSLITVGRLDKNTIGLLLITNDGNFAQNIIHPSNKIEKEYQITTKNIVTKLQLEKLQDGVALDDGPAKAKSAKMTGDNSLTIIIEEGRNRIVRRMIAAVGNEVTALKRTRVGNIKLDIKDGTHRELNSSEIEPYIN